MVYRFVFTADIRSLDIFDRDVPAVSNEEIEVFRKLTKKLKFKYNVKMFDNPYLHVNPPPPVQLLQRL